MGNKIRRQKPAVSAGGKKVSPIALSKTKDSAMSSPPSQSGNGAPSLVFNQVDSLGQVHSLSPRYRLTYMCVHPCNVS